MNLPMPKQDTDASSRHCPTCKWAVPDFVPDYLMWSALTDHKANDCKHQPAVDGGDAYR